MRIHEITEGKVKDRLYNLEYDRQHGKQPAPTLPAPELNYYITINGNPWKRDGKFVQFSDEKSALRAATSLHNKRPTIKVSVMPFKK